MDEGQGFSLLTEAWHGWVAGAILLFISELLTPGGFLLASLGIGASATALLAAFGLGINAQIACFALCSLLVYFGVRPFYLKSLQRGRDDRVTGAEAYIGREGRVTEAIPAKGLGRIDLGGESWKARSQEGLSLDPGQPVRVTAMEGLTLVVTQA